MKGYSAVPETLEAGEASGRRRAIRASPPVFPWPFLDRLTRTHAATPTLLFGPLGLGLIASGVGAVGWRRAAALVVAGYVAWTLAEYWIHRIAYHCVAPVRFGPRVQWMIHGIHHDHPNDAGRPMTPPLATLPPLVAVIWFICWTLGSGTGPVVAGGFTLGYLSHELVHHHLHRRRPSTRLGRYLRRCHMRHHFRDERTWFGVTCPYWDYVFGTTGRGSPRETSR